MNYPPGPYVLLKDVKKAIYNFPPAYREVVNNLPKYNLPDSQAEELLTKVCENLDTENFSVEDVPGLIEWWTKYKPKSEREQKLEKIKSILSHNFSVASDTQVKLSAEELLQALNL